MEKCGNKEHHTCNHPISSASQTLDELEFERGPWSAALEGDLERLRNLLEKRLLDVDILDSSGYASLHYASRAGHLDLVRYLISKGADINKTTRGNSSTPLHKATIAGRAEVVKFLLDRGARSDLADAAGHTPLHYANSELMKYFPASKCI